jgi:hypothetical protein
MYVYTYIHNIHIRVISRYHMVKEQVSSLSCWLPIPDLVWMGRTSVDFSSKALLE